MTGAGSSSRLAGLAVAVAKIFQDVAQFVRRVRIKLNAPAKATEEYLAGLK